MRAELKKKETEAQKSEQIQKANDSETFINKKPYTPATLEKRRKLTDLFRVHGHSKTESWYAKECLLTTITTARYLSKLQVGVDITQPFEKRGRKRIVDNDTLNQIVREKMKLNPLTTLRKVAHEMTNAGHSIGKSSVHKILTERNSETHKFPLFSFKRITVRPSAGNSEENKLQRIHFVEKLFQYQRDGAIPFFIDETSWNISCIRKCGWSEKGDKVLVPPPPLFQSVTAITSISMNGMGYTEVVRGTINHELFEAYLKRFLLSIKSFESSVIVMDNASIHHVNTDEIILQSGHKVLFNAAYSPDLNPIENIFGIWKAKVEENSLKWEDESHFISTMLQTFQKISAREVRKTIMHVENDVWPLVLEKKDL
ncbi:putative DDE superfamily endonuclease [Monocercomonoides exilis]|uniref:putative DDE superfamily endonuclease n=1 Tax=Monocercomonoides exilis TaxID=2049356 RepID=UPI00355956D4|nr:putative DDE superfamily endonuclease [Monocercomonoides exilis]|eukprot:MONOS_3302.1-p1 / transcript=MONOS_3302.1 / gene=MONOS_3302 / organism=Monocercomonoides_exilis_PA203 / gene_product=unspecified product / transcript_product=unspecified product / location=Mono_scaffold00076:135855-136967(-) / protein_length=370 / sequence_SO=supercontig / SO=protein_coding / is_pseudo=false